MQKGCIAHTKWSLGIVLVPVAMELVQSLLNAWVFWSTLSPALQVRCMHMFATYIHAHAYTCMSVCMYVCMYVCVFASSTRVVDWTRSASLASQPIAALAWCSCLP